MAVIEYKEGSHKSGFIGFRVDTTVGGERWQEYFSINEYEYGDAKKRAQALNDKWRALAEEHNLIHRLNDMWLPNQVCIGLTADIERRARILNSGASSTSYSPVFSVSVGNRRSPKRFSIIKMGYQHSYRSAVRLFCEFHGYSHHIEKKLFKRQPEPEMFTGYLFNKKFEKYRDIYIGEIEEKLLAGGCSL